MASYWLTRLKLLKFFILSKLNWFVFVRVRVFNSIFACACIVIGVWAVV
jgi:hypothetical protein